MSESVNRLRKIVERLRAPEGCPWDREQTHRSLRSALLEECYEVLEAIDNEDDENLNEELGDLLLLVVMHARLGEERAVFDLDKIAENISEKLIRRHPHVFGDAKAENSDEVLKQWEDIKRSEKRERKSILDGVPRALPALLRASKIQKKAARVGFDWPDVRGAQQKLEEEMQEVKEALASKKMASIEEELGDLLFALVNVARKHQLEGEHLLSNATDKFARRFQVIEEEIKIQGKRVQDCSLEELDAIWEKAKSLTKK
ncbi:MAG: nucleoside triphosphate pyrophosphohydrolase [Chthoniobacterales bacterium]